MGKTSKKAHVDTWTYDRLNRFKRMEDDAIISTGRE